MTHDTFLRRRARIRFSALALATGLLSTGAAAWAAPSGVADALAKLGTGRTVTRTVSFADLGIREPLVMPAPDTRQELYLPVPVGVPLADATLQVDGGYLHADGGRTSMLLSLDGAPVLARSFPQQQGDAGVNIGVDGAARDSGFVRVGLQWSSVIDERICTDQTAIGNVLRVAPTSRLTYRFDPAAIRDLRTAWSALPIAPVVAVSARRVGAGAYDAGWRVATQLERESRKPVMRAWPAAGETVDLSGVEVPAALRAVPAFASLAAGGAHKLADAAEVGALIVLAPRAAFAPDIVIADDAMRRDTNAALEALRAQIATASPDGAAAFDTWRARSLAALVQPLAAGEVRIARLNGQTAIVVGDAVGVAALARAWRPIDVADRVVVHRLDATPYAHADSIALAALGGEPRTLDVLGRASWDASFDLGAVAGDGKLPAEVVLDVSAAPTPQAQGEIASLYFNDVLIASELLHQDGKPQRITAHVPRYALAPTNLLRVVFQRRPDGGCQARPQGYPVAVLPTSRLLLETAGEGDDFTGMVARFASAANVIVPTAYLDDATATLPRLAALAHVAGVAPNSATLTVAGAAPVTPKGPFLAADVLLENEKGRAQLSNDRMTLTDQSNRVFADVSGLSKLAVIEVAEAGGAKGVVYRTLGGEAPHLPATLRLARGDIALVSDSRTATVFDSHHPGQVVTDDDAGIDRIGRWLPWLIAAVLIALLVALILGAGVARRRHQDRQGES